MTASIKRGDVFLVNFDPTVGAEVKKIRPAMVVSNDINNAHSPIISIAPVTSNVRRVYRFEVEIAAGSGCLQSRAKVMINQTRAVDKVRLVKRLGRIGPPMLDAVDRAIALHYGLRWERHG